MTDRRRELLRVAERETDRAVTAHRKARCRPPAPLRFRRERPINPVHQLDAKSRSVLIALMGIAVKPPPTIRHHDDQRQSRHIPLDAGSPQPDRVIIGEAVQQGTSVGYGGFPTSGKITKAVVCFTKAWLK